MADVEHTSAAALTPTKVKQLYAFPNIGWCRLLRYVEQVVGVRTKEACVTPYEECVLYLLAEGLLVEEAG
jgi:hypothetical protein